MKKATCIVCLAASGVVLCSAARAGDVIGEWSDDFEGYPLGADVVGLGGWEHWDDEPVSLGARVTDAMVHGGTRSLVITGDESGAGKNDSPLQRFDITSGIWDLTVWQFIPASADFGRNGIILLNQYEHGCATGECNWSAQIVVDTAAGTIESQFQGDIFPYPSGQWNEIRVRINTKLCTTSAQITASIPPINA
jgi:hypothetical protein